MGWEGYSAKSPCVTPFCFCLGESHSHAEKAVGIGCLHVLQVVILIAVDDFLHHYGSSYLCIVHVAEEYLCRVLPVYHERWQHLPLLSEEKAAGFVSFHLAYLLAFYCRVLALP